jgi:hypothetical protein
MTGFYKKKEEKIKTHRILKVNFCVDGNKVFHNGCVTVFTASVQARLSQLE